MDDIVITGDDIVEIVDLKKYLAQEFEVKDLGQMIYFVQIEISGGSKGMFLSQRKYVLDLLKETETLRCLPEATPIEKNHRLSKDVGTPVD